MKATNKLRKRKAISPVIATVILVAVAITVAVGVSYWMSGIAGQYTGFEKVEIQSAVCTLDTTGNFWTTIVNLKNSGTKGATLTDVFVNDAKATLALDPPTVFTGITAYLDEKIIDTVDTPCPLHLASGETGTVTVWIGYAYGTLSSGTAVNIKIHSASGMDYIKLVQMT